MVRLYSWALAEKALSYLPGGRTIYKSCGYMVQRRRRGWEARGKPELSFVFARRAKELIPPGGTAMEVGTGWFNHDAILLYLVGDYTVYLFDIEDNAKFAYLRNYIMNLLDKIDIVCRDLEIDRATTRDKLERLLRARDKDEIYKVCRFVPCVTTSVYKPFLPSHSIDFMVGNCVINHIPLSMLVPELLSLKEMLTDNGRMYFLIRHDDHWAFHDSTANQFNYYQYSDKTYRLLFENKLEFQNRLVKPEWQEIFKRCGLEEEERVDVTDEDCTKMIRALPRIDSRFAGYSLADLAISYSYVLLRKKAPSASGLVGN